MASYLQESLSNGETIQHQFNLHWIHWMNCYSVVVAAFTIIIFSFLYQDVLGKMGLNHLFFSFLVAIGAAVVVSITNLILGAQEQGVTNRRIVQKTGLVSRNTNEISLDALETVELKQSILGRIFGFADIKVTGRGAAVIVFNGLSDPSNVKRAIENEAARIRDGRLSERPATSV